MISDILFALVPLILAFLAGWVHGESRAIVKQTGRLKLAHQFLFHRAHEGELAVWSSTIDLMNYMAGSPLPDRMIYVSMEHPDVLTTLDTEIIIEELQSDAG